MRFLRSVNFCVFIIGLWSMGVVVAGNEEAKIVFCYGQDSVEEAYELSEATDILNHPGFDSNRKTVLYIHGYNETPSSTTVQKIIAAYTERDTYNILILDWGKLAAWIYPIAVSNANLLGPKIAETFLHLFNTGMLHSKLHIVGHSLGAQLAGQIGRTIIEQSNGLIKLQRISGLDPAFPEYYPISVGGSSAAISERDAVFVDIIHTDRGLYGAPCSTGTVDFWPNGGGRIQPGCPDDLLMVPLSDKELCSHQRSVSLWAESVANSSSTFFATHEIFNSTIVQMGIGCAINATRGDYRLNTNAAPPYSK